MSSTKSDSAGIPRQFAKYYHGTTADIPIGGRILPKRDVVKFDKNAINTDTVRDDAAHATTDEKTAWSFGFWNAGKAGRVRVYEVEPGTNFRHVEDDPHAENEALADYFVVKNRIDIQPGHQGTLPLDWGKYTKSSYDYDYAAASHPDRTYEIDEPEIAAPIKPATPVKQIKQIKNIKLRKN